MENRAREERRQFFEALKDQWGAKWIATAHHADDNIESIMLHFLRGAGPAGLAGVEKARNGYLRPFLGFSKKEIFQYCRARKLKFRNDRTNKKNSYRRNLLRNKIFPLLKKINPHFQKTVQQNSVIFRSLSGFLESEAENFLEKNEKNGVLFPLQNFKKLPDALKQAVIQKSFQKATGSTYRMPYKMVSAVSGMLDRGIGKKKIGSTKKGFFVLEKGSVSYTCNPG